MGRTPCCAKVGLNRGSWTAVEDKILADYIQIHGEGRWKQLPKNAGLMRCGKSCRLRWLNYLRPDIKRGNISEDEEELIVRLHKLLGNRWSLIAGRIPGRTDNEIKNYWNTNLSKKASSSSSLSPVAITTKNPNKMSQFTKLENTSTLKNAMSVPYGTNSTRVFRTRATKCSKVVIQSPPPPPPPVSTSTYNIIQSHDQGDALGVDSLFNDLPMMMNSEIDDDLSLGDFCLDDFLNGDEFDVNQSNIIISTDKEKDRDALETVHRVYDRHEYRSQMMSGQSCTNVGSDVNNEKHDQLCPMFIDSYNNNWDF